MPLKGPVGVEVRSSARSMLNAACGPLLLAGCTPNRTQNALEPAGPQASELEWLSWLAFSLAAAIYIAVVVALAYSAAHGRRRKEHVLPVDPHVESRSTRWVGVATGASILVLFGFLAADLLVSRKIGAMQREPAMHVRVTGNQWWWRLEYADTNPSRVVATANELHLPVGRIVELELETSDVIHSFWVPSLGGKRDLVPGQKNRLWLQADSVGTYRGQCAEYCGLQHAKMALTVVVHDSADFNAWYNAQLPPAAAPSDSLRQRGMQTFLRSSCVLCHQVRGTPAAGQVGPDLTHVGSRGTLAAGAIPNTRGHMGGWISDPQGVKPGTRMPPTKLAAAELQALIAYLEGLK